MVKETVKFGEKIIEKSDLYRKDTKLFNTEDINLDKIELSMKKKMAKKLVIKINIYIYVT